MTDDVFKLGNFSGVDENADPKSESDGLEDLDQVITDNFASAQAKQEGTPPSPSPLSSPVQGEEVSVMKHPTVRADPQAKFKTRDGEPLLELELSEIVPNEFQPRRVFNEAKLRELANSIREHGIIQPLVVVKRDDGKYEIVVGERRFRAAKIAGLSRVPVFVNSAITPETKLEFALIENIQRADLNPIEEAKAYERLRDEFLLTVGQIAKKVGKDTSTISNLLRLLNLPVEIQRALVEGKISEGQARPLLSLRDHEEMLQLYEIILREQMKVRDIENKVREIRQRRIKVKEMFTPDPFLESLKNLLRNKLGTRVEVNKGAKGGKITIEFYSDEELNDIIGKIT